MGEVDSSCQKHRILAGSLQPQGWDPTETVSPQRSRMAYIVPVTSQSRASACLRIPSHFAVTFTCVRPICEWYCSWFPQDNKGIFLKITLKHRCMRSLAGVRTSCTVQYTGSMLLRATVPRHFSFSARNQIDYTASEQSIKAVMRQKFILRLISRKSHRNLCNTPAVAQEQWKQESPLHRAVLRQRGHDSHLRDTAGNCIRAAWKSYRSLTGQHWIG